MPSTSQASATVISTSQGATPRRARPGPPRPGRGHGSATGSRCQPKRALFRPCDSATSAATTAPSETTQVTSAGVVVRW